MKKNININLFGTLYSIDEDAYELLKKYQDNMRSYYSRREGGEEIADDVEHRVAELFAELRKQGFEAITIEQVEEIIHRIGDLLGHFRKALHHNVAARLLKLDEPRFEFQIFHRITFPVRRGAHLLRNLADLAVVSDDLVGQRTARIGPKQRL